MGTLEGGGAAWSGAERGDPEVGGSGRSGLHRAYLHGADLSGADLSGAILDDRTLKRSAKLKGALRGVNGIWVESTDSAALMRLTPPGNSMHGRNSDAVIESLKHARRLHGISIGLALLALGILFLQAHSETAVDTFSLPFIPDLKFPVKQFGLLGIIIISIGLLSLVKSFMNDALAGARYLLTRDDAMTVGSFPWALSRYTGQRWDSKLQSYLTRFAMAYHPFAYAAFWDWPVPWYYWGLSGMLLLFCTWIFVISQRFQRPILFDRRTEEKNRKSKSDLEKQTEAIRLRSCRPRWPRWYLYSSRSNRRRNRARRMRKRSEKSAMLLLRADSQIPIILKIKN